MKSASLSAAFAVATGFLAVSSASASTAKARQASASKDDADMKVFHYHGNWQHLSNRGDLDYQGTVSVTSEIDATVTFYVKSFQQFNWYANKQANGGVVEFYNGANDDFLGSTKLSDSAYTTGPSQTQLVFSSGPIVEAGNITAINKGSGELVLVQFDYADIF
ncbi:MAG: hypothetical protein CYPHOPRED_000255 [Cyphobasidiales sp. Tagirdzhanova-0007]|nr:MAG: hypothetical protein CYPHOPRED_000255 [Cyphobasidiales sp. Tagirdzhanova-0007]